MPADGPVPPHPPRKSAATSPRKRGEVKLAPSFARKPSLRRRQMPYLAGDLGRYRRGPRRAAAALDVDFHPVDFPAARRADAVHRGGALDAARMRAVQEHEWLLAAADLLDLLPQQAAILHDRLVRRAEVFVGAVLDRA